MQLKQCAGMVAEEKAVFDSLARIVGSLADINPALFPCRGDEIKSGNAQSESSAHDSPEHRSPGTVKQRSHQRDSRK